jgi:hypothetical protein
MAPKPTAGGGNPSWAPGQLARSRSQSGLNGISCTFAPFADSASSSHGARRLIVRLHVAAIPAGAIPPTGDCPPAFGEPSSFEQILIDFPPPPDLSPEDVIAILDFFDKNDDEMLCVLDVPAPGINLIDNNASIP